MTNPDRKTEREPETTVTSFNRLAGIGNPEIDANWEIFINELRYSDFDGFEHLREVLNNPETRPEYAFRTLAELSPLVQSDAKHLSLPFTTFRMNPKSEYCYPPSFSNVGAPNQHALDLMIQYLPVILKYDIQAISPDQSELKQQRLTEYHTFVVKILRYLHPQEEVMRSCQQLLKQSLEELYSRPSENNWPMDPLLKSYASWAEMPLCYRLTYFQVVADQLQQEKPENTQALKRFANLIEIEIEYVFFNDSRDYKPILIGRKDHSYKREMDIEALSFVLHRYLAEKNDRKISPDISVLSPKLLTDAYYCCRGARDKNLFIETEIIPFLTGLSLESPYDSYFYDHFLTFVRELISKSRVAKGAKQILAEQAIKLEKLWELKKEQQLSSSSKSDFEVRAKAHLLEEATEALKAK